MKKFILLTLFTVASLISYSQDIAISFYQGGVLCEGRTSSNKYILGCQNRVCTFDASFSQGANGTVIMNVYNPNVQGFIPATYYIFPNNTLSVYANGYKIATGRWQIISNGSSSPSFRGKLKNSCNIRSHNCSGGVDSNGDGWCDNCYSHGYKCHMVDHVGSK